MSSDIAKREGKDIAQRFQPNGLGELEKFARMVIKSSLAPDSIKSPEDAMIIIMTGADLGLNPMASLQNIHVIKGQPSLSAKMKHALCLQSPDCEYFEIIEWTSEICTAKAKRKSDTAPLEFSFSMKDAEDAGLTSHMYRKYPKNMLKARCISTLADAKFPEVTLGIYTHEEVREIGEIEEVNSTKSLNAKFAPKKEEVVDAEFEPNEPTTEERTAKMVEAFAGEGVIVEQLEQHAGKSVDEFDEGDLETMKDAYKYIRGDAAMRDELFPPVVEESEPEEAIVDEDGNELPDV